MAIKFYAVRAGKVPGIYTSWNECKKQVDGFPSAAYKSFTDRASAEKFMESSSNQSEKNASLKTVKAYIDGSFSEDQNQYAFGCVLIHDGGMSHLSGASGKPEFVAMRNVAGELLAAMNAAKWAIKHKFQHLILYHDYEGIEKWVTKDWKANLPGTKQYVEYMTKSMGTIDIDFVKVKAHSGDQYNEMADKLAKSALNIKGLPESSINSSNSLIDTLFKAATVTKSRSKEEINFKVRGFSLTEKAIKKFILSHWESEGYLKDDISSFKASVDVEKMRITWEVEKRDKTMEKFEYQINQY